MQLVHLKLLHLLAFVLQRLLPKFVRAHVYHLRFYLLHVIARCFEAKALPVVTPIDLREDGLTLGVARVYFIRCIRKIRYIQLGSRLSSPSTDWLVPHLHSNCFFMSHKSLFCSLTLRSCLISKIGCWLSQRRRMLVQNSDFVHIMRICSGRNSRRLCWKFTIILEFFRLTLWIRIVACLGQLLQSFLT